MGASSADDNRTLILCVVLIPLLSFYVLSYISLRWGTLCRLRSSLASPLQRSYRVIGHRGSKLEGFSENTLPAFKRAVSIPVDVVELDVWLTLDGHVVVFHDGVFGRMCGGKEGHVNRTAYKDLPAVVGDQPPDGGGGKMGKEEGRADTSTKIPLFSEVLESLPPSMGLIVEFKENTDELVSKVHELLKKHNRTTNGTTVWFSLKWKTNKKLRNFDSTIPTICSVEELLISLVLYYLWLLPFVSLNHDIFGLPSFEINPPTLKSWVPFLPMWLCHVLNMFLGGKPSAFFNVPKLVAHLKSRGYPTWVLGVKDEQEVDFVKSVGASGALSDLPEWLKTTFEKKNVFEDDEDKSNTVGGGVTQTKPTVQQKTNRI